MCENGNEAHLKARIYFSVPFVEKEQASRLGARWDTARGAWYISTHENMEKFARWRLEDVLESAARNGMASGTQP